jgi:hypothetical protein
MLLLGVGVERYHDVAIERLHERDARQHRMTATAAQHQRLDCDLPVSQAGFLLRQLRNIVGRVLQREQLPAVGQNDGIVKTGRPRRIAVIGNFLVSAFCFRLQPQLGQPADGFGAGQRITIFPSTGAVPRARQRGLPKTRPGKVENARRRTPAPRPGVALAANAMRR